ncbi:MAG: RNA polymerase sigma factor [Pirellulaceae bacterium]
MEIHWTYEGCDDQEIARISQYWDRVQSELAGKVAELSDAPSELRLAVEQDDAANSWGIQAALHLPGTTLVAEASARTPEKALDQVLHGLALDIDQLEETPAQETLRREGLDEVAVLLDACRVRKSSSEAFISFLTPVVNSLASYVRRELRIQEYEGRLVGESVTTADVLDEVIVSAWERYPSRPRTVPLDLWLVQLADEAILQLSGTNGAQSLEDESPVERDDSEDASWEECAEMATASEDRELREVVPGHPSIDSWDELDMETKQAHLAELFAALPRERRQAFVLNLVHGFNTAEIADFQVRPVGDVEADIAAATASIRRQFASESTPDLEEPFIRRDLRQQRRKRR